MKEFQEMVLNFDIVHRGYSRSFIAQQFQEKTRLEVWFYTRSSDGNGWRKFRFLSLECEPDQLPLVSKIKLLEKHFNTLVGKTITLFWRDQTDAFHVRLPAGHEAVSYQDFKKQLSGFVSFEVPQPSQSLPKQAPAAVLPKLPEKKESALLELRPDARAPQERDWRCAECLSEFQPMIWNRLDKVGCPIRYVSGPLAGHPEICGNFSIDKNSKPVRSVGRCRLCLDKHPEIASYPYRVAEAKLIAFRLPFGK